MTAARNLLVELFVEELPPKALKALGTSFALALARGLHDRGFIAGSLAYEGFATPRRLAVLIERVQPESSPREIPAENFMPAAVAYDANGRPTPALVKKIRKRYQDDVDVDAIVREKLETVDENGKQMVKHRAELASPGRLPVGLQAALEDAIAQLPIPKVMQYQLADGWKTVSFVRPAHGLVALHGSEVVPASVLGLDAGRTTHGHRFEARVPTITLRDADSYAAQLRDEGAVIASFAERRAEIDAQLAAAAAKESLRPIDDEALRDEVTGLVERPNVLLCRFDEEFLAVPPECLVLTMKANQKYFPLLDGKGRLTNRFLVVSNIRPADPSRIVEGNERVVRPRLADAKFFFDQDRKRTLASRVAGLDQVVYHGKLGSQGDRVRRLRRIARWVAERVGADPDLAERAAELAKADLLTDMVGEFPELQGVMGAYYAAHDGEAADVVAAIRDQYVNRRGNAGETEQASNLIGECLLIADRAESLVGIWGIGLKPTGDRDPFALRRHALTLIAAFEVLGAAAAFTHSTMRLALHDLLAFVKTTFDVALAPNVVEELEDFIYERYFNQLTALYDGRTVDAVTSRRAPLHETVQRVEAVQQFLQLPEALALAAANKRVSNILKKSDGAAVALDATLLAEPAEHALAAALAEVGERADAAYRDGDYARSLGLLAGLKPAVDAFFDTVMVNVESPSLRANRLALLATLRETMNRVADLSRLAV